MGILKKLFKKKDKQKNEDNIVKEELGHNIDPHTPKCESCKLPILQWDKPKTFDKKKYHVKCFRKIRKQASKMAFSGGI